MRHEQNRRSNSSRWRVRLQLLRYARSLSLVAVGTVESLWKVIFPPGKGRKKAAATAGKNRPLPVRPDLMALEGRYFPGQMMPWSIVGADLALLGPALSAVSDIISAGEMPKSLGSMVTAAPQQTPPPQSPADSDFGASQIALASMTNPLLFTDQPTTQSTAASQPEQREPVP